MRLIPKISSRLRNFVGNRRETPRYKPKKEPGLIASAVLLKSANAPESKLSSKPILGRTLDISETGLSLILPSIGADEEQRISPDCTLRIILALPEMTVHMIANTVYCEAVVEAETELDYIVGVVITEIGNDDRTHLIEYLSALRK